MAYFFVFILFIVCVCVVLLFRLNITPSHRLLPYMMLQWFCQRSRFFSCFDLFHVSKNIEAHGCVRRKKKKIYFITFYFIALASALPIGPPCVHMWHEEKKIMYSKRQRAMWKINKQTNKQKKANKNTLKGSNTMNLCDVTKLSNTRVFLLFHFG